MELRSRDGTTYTGVLVVERSELVMMLAVRHPPGSSPAERPRSPIVTPPPGSQRTLYETFTDLDPDDPRWDQDGDPFRR